VVREVKEENAENALVGATRRAMVVESGEKRQSSVWRE